MIKIRAFLGLMLLLLSINPSWAQIEKYKTYFQEAYKKYPTIPKGMLEAVAMTNTHGYHLKYDAAEPDHMGMPKYYGVMGLVEDGKGYFQNNLQIVSDLSKYSIDQIKNDPRINILAYAAAYAETQKTQGVTSRSLEVQGDVLSILSELPAQRDGDEIAQYAYDQMFFSVLKQAEKQMTKEGERATINYEKVFGKTKSKLLQATDVNLERDLTNRSTGGCNGGYGGAIWNPANKNNYGVGRKGEAIDLVVIHTTQGPYHGAINWFRNPNARVSAHYVVRSFDGQITQMVCEENRGFHAGGDDNLISIGIEHEGWIEEGANWYTDAMYEASANLVKDICKRYDINPLKMYSGKGTNTAIDLSNKCRKIKGHQHLPSNQNGHIDPGKDWDWDKYYKLINGEMPDNVEKYTDASGTIYDSGGPNGDYKVQERKGYLIQPTGATSISIEVKEIDLEGTNAKPYDYLDIFEGKNSDHKLLARLTGKIPPSKPIIAQGGSVYMEFRSDCADCFKGWKINYSSDKKASSLGSPSEVSVSNIYPMGAALSWKKGAGAAKTVINLRRSIDDKWTSFSTTNNEFHLSGLACNSKYLYQVLSVNGKDSSVSEKGSFATPQISREGAAKTYTTTATEGKLADSGGLSNPYSDKEDYTLIIAPSTGGKVTLSFSSFDTENTDILYVYDGADTKGKLLGQFSGTKVPQIVTTTKSAMTIRFKSDTKIHNKGWNGEWKTSGSGTPVPPPPTPTPTPTPVPTPTPTPTPTTTSNFDINLPYNSQSPSTQPLLDASYSKDATISFSDKDNSTKGIANRFYLIAENTGKGWRANKDKGFFVEDFNKALSADWKAFKGTWENKDGRIVQKNDKESNANLYAKIPQGAGIYLYQWQLRINSGADNQRLGFHFFCNDVEKENRGSSYFIWVRDASTGDKIEIYKVGTDDKFAKKAEANAKFEKGIAYDFKTIYDANTGKIEVFINNKSIVSWTDATPLKTGKAISLRTANCAADFDNVLIYKGRSNTVTVTVGNDPSKDFRVVSNDAKTPTVKVESIVLDKAGAWSPPIAATSRVVGFVKKENTSTPTSPQIREGGSVSGNFELKVDAQEEVIQPFYLVSDYDGKRWNAHHEAGCLSEDFAGGKLKEGWLSEGKWSFVDGAVQQTDATAKNTKLTFPLKQSAEDVWLYSFRFKLDTKGDDKRLGLYLFADDAGGKNRGNSYLVWFRNNDTKGDLVELYRSIDDNLTADKIEKTAKITPEKWHDVKIVLEPTQGKFAVWLDGKKIAYMEDKNAPISSGSYLSFRTAECKVQFDDLRVYRAVKGNDLITVGKSATDMIRTDKGRIQFINLEKSGLWKDGAVQPVSVVK